MNHKLEYVEKNPWVGGWLRCQLLLLGPGLGRRRMERAGCVPRGYGQRSRGLFCGSCCGGGICLTPRSIGTSRTRSDVT